MDVAIVVIVIVASVFANDFPQFISSGDNEPNSKQPQNNSDDDDDDDDEATSPLMACHMHRAVPIYGEAYGYESEVWGAIQTNVMSNLLTFVNHGCNGTANIAPTVPGLNEFTLDPTAENYTIPDAFKSLDPSDADAYNPAHERGVGRSRHTVAVYEPIRRGQELFDNYLEFGGETYFDENILELKSDCSGGAGMVEQAQLVKKQTNRNGRGSKSSKHNTITSTSSSSSTATESETAITETITESNTKISDIVETLYSKEGELIGYSCKQVVTKNTVEEMDMVFYMDILSPKDATSTSTSTSTINYHYRRIGFEIGDCCVQ
mmetsp:Transcript_23799/g.52037  ORF Transcript_23799/g.52037 Transcript_23799/m.52037 type:complete len:321 (-) Transcript_23799:1553-2515(-)